MFDRLGTHSVGKHFRMRCLKVLSSVSSGGGFVITVARKVKERLYDKYHAVHYYSPLYNSVTYFM